MGECTAEEVPAVLSRQFQKREESFVDFSLAEGKARVTCVWTPEPRSGPNTQQGPTQQGSERRNKHIQVGKMSFSWRVKVVPSAPWQDGTTSLIGCSVLRTAFLPSSSELPALPCC